MSENRLESKSQSKVQAPNPKRQIQKGKGEIGLWFVSKICWANRQPHTHPTSNF